MMTTKQQHTETSAVCSAFCWFLRRAQELLRRAPPTACSLVCFLRLPMSQQQQQQQAVRSRASSTTLRDITTELAISLFADNVLLIITQNGKMGTLVRRAHIASYRITSHRIASHFV